MTGVTLQICTIFLIVGGAWAVQAPVNLLTAANYVILTKTGITTTGTTAIVGNIATSPASATAITGFGLILAPDGTYSTSSLVTGKVYAANYASPTPATLTQAIKDLVTAYNDAVSRSPPDHLNFGINGPSTLSAGLYKWTAGITVSGTVTLSGNATSVFIFQVSGTLGFQASANIILSGGVLPSNVVWQVTQTVTLSAGAKVQGIILGKTNIVFKSNKLQSLSLPIPLPSLESTISRLLGANYWIPQILSYQTTF